MLTEQSNRSSPLNVPIEDLQRCHNLLGIESWNALAKKRVFITGGTGFIGKWLLATLLDADEALGLDCHVTVLSRDPASFQRDWPAIKSRVEWVAGDVRTFSIVASRFDIIIHAATDVVASSSPDDVFSTCLDGTRRVLLLARQSGAKQLLLLSSGAVYGPLPANMTNVPETYLGGPDPLQSSSAYGEGKRVSEWLATQASGNGLEVKIARIFTLIGPHLPLDSQFAVGNFLRSAIAKEEIRILGDGTPYRSYLYCADMAAWLWKILIYGKSCRAYNVGSDKSISISALAKQICIALNQKENVKILGSNQGTGQKSYYVPNISRIQRELNLSAPLNLDEAIVRTAKWHLNNKCASANMS